MKDKFKAAAVLAAFKQMEAGGSGQTTRKPPDKDAPKEPLQRFSVARGKKIYVCPNCWRRVHQFDVICLCRQRLKWNIRVE